MKKNSKIILLLILGILATLTLVLTRYYKIAFVYKPGNVEKPIFVLRQNDTIRGVILNDNKTVNCSQQYYLKTENGMSFWLISADQNENNTSLEKFYHQDVEVNGDYEYEREDFCPIKSDICTCGKTVFYRNIQQLSK